MWSVGLVAVGRAAAGEPQVIQDIAAEQSESELRSENLKHIFHLRPEVQVAFELPLDLSSGEAERLADFIRTLPFEGEDEG